MTSRAAALALLMVAVPAACSRRQDDASQGAMAAAVPGSGIYPQSKLELEADPGAVLVKIGGKPAITVAEFNTRLGEFPIGDEGQDAFAARRKVVNKMIDFKFIVREAAKRRSPGKRAIGPEPGSAAERALALELVRSSVANPLLVTEDEAQTYYAAHKEAFRQFDASNSSPEERTIYIKLTLLSERFQERIRKWRSQQTVEISEDLLKR